MVRDVVPMMTHMAGSQGTGLVHRMLRKLDAAGRAKTPEEKLFTLDCGARVAALEQLREDLRFDGLFCRGADVRNLFGCKCFSREWYIVKLALRV